MPTFYWLKRVFLLCGIIFFIQDSWLEAFQHQLSLGPEICYLTRTREGGTEQSGTLYGFRAIFDSLERYKIYYGLEGAYAAGILKGHSGSDIRLKSVFSQGNLEGRLGYTFQSQSKQYISLTPYGSVGYFLELNNYKKPSPMHIHFRNRFFYGGVGCMLKGCLRPCLDFALNVSVRYSIDGKMTASHDPEFDSSTIKYMQKMLCRVSLPLNYHYRATNLRHCFTCTPFFEYRHYGKKRAIPFDFLDTRIRCWGVDLMYSFCF